MSNEVIDDGGPAYPQTMQTMPNGDYIWPEQGMTLRDRIAIAAMQGFLHGNWEAKECDVAQWSYSQADAMLKQRKQS